MAGLRHCRHLVIVCGHATYIGKGHDLGEASWLLQDFQRSDENNGKPGEHETFITQILAGRQILRRDSTAVLVLSGGRTAHGEISEAAGYENVMRGLALPTEDDHRIFLEEFATDSYQNLLFSILLYRKHTGSYPERITVITHAFKERRFLELHGPAIRWAANRLRVQGINPPFTGMELAQAERGEEKNGYGRFASDLYGMHEPLSSKREIRRWSSDHLETLSFSGIEPVVERLLRWDGGADGREIFPQMCPWEE